MPKANVISFKGSVGDLKACLSALCRLFMDQYGEDEVSKKKDLDRVRAFIARADRSAPAGGGIDA